jgi:SAM-dependent methyltransferase
VHETAPAVGARTDRQTMRSDAAARCLVCAGVASDCLYRLSRFDVQRCRACAQVFIHPLPSEAEIAALFAQLYREGKGSVPELQNYYAACFDVSPSGPVTRLSRSWLHAIARHAPGGRLLDIGCGTGLFCNAAREFGWQPTGIDDAAAAVAFARSRFGLDIKVGDFETLALAPGGYDLVTMWDVLEHSRAPRRLLDVAAQCLAPGGLLALSTPNQHNIMEAVARPLYRLTGGRLRAPLEKFYLIEHFLYFSAVTLRHILTAAGFEVIEMRRELTDLSRLTLHPFVRAGLEALFLVSRPLGLENRLFAIARKPAAA